MKTYFNRRRFLQTAVANGAGLVILASGRSVYGYPENEKLSIAVIGAGGRGAANLSEVSSENIVALCDVDERRAAESFAKHSGIPKFQDYRRMLDKLDGQVEAVVISAPNHIHIPAAVAAMRRGKHVYCEKPLAHSVSEARLAASTASETGVATQMGTQIHATDNYRRIVELIRGGAIGIVRECHCWLRGGGSAGDRPKETPPVPAGLNWDLWLGPAPRRPYHQCYVPHDWHYWWDFGGGAFGNMGCHYLDLAFWALKLRYPSSIESDGPPAHLESTPAWQHVRYRFAPIDGAPDVLLTWTHGKTTHPVFSRHAVPDWAWGVFVGDKGMLAVSYDQRQLLPDDVQAGFVPPSPSIAPSPGHHREWITACKTGSPTLCNFDYSSAVTEAVLLGNIAYRAGERLQWDAVKLRFPNCPHACEYLNRDYRDGWEL